MRSGHHVTFVNHVGTLSRRNSYSAPARSTFTEFPGKAGKTLCAEIQTFSMSCPIGSYLDFARSVGNDDDYACRRHSVLYIYRVYRLTSMTRITCKTAITFKDFHDVLSRMLLC